MCFQIYPIVQMFMIFEVDVDFQDLSYVSKCCMIHLPLLAFGACIPKGSPARFEACELVGERVAHLAGIQLADIRQ